MSTKDKKVSKDKDMEDTPQLLEMENNWKRALADYRNLQKRVEEEKGEIVKFANFVLCAELLPILDNLKMLCEHSEDEGMRLITKGFSEVLENSGVEEIQVAAGDLFDPGIMEAFEGVENDSARSVCVASVVRNGYKMRGRLIRPVQVKVKVCEKIS